MADTLRDVDTGLLNEAYFRAALPNRVATARRVLRPVSVAVLAVGPAETTPAVAHALQDTLRDSDTACRLADGRFALLLEDTPEEGAVWTLQRLRQVLAEQGHDVVLWGGVAAYPAHALESADLMRLAEEALTVARRWATDRIEVAPPS